MNNHGDGLIRVTGYDLRIPKLSIVSGSYSIYFSLCVCDEFEMEGAGVGEMDRLRRIICSQWIREELSHRLGLGVWEAPGLRVNTRTAAFILGNNVRSWDVDINRLGSRLVVHGYVFR